MLPAVTPPFSLQVAIKGSVSDGGGGEEGAVVVVAVVVMLVKEGGTGSEGCMGKVSLMAY